MPGFYPPGEYDLAGFLVGTVEQDRLITGARLRPGDRLIGLRSAGLHTNGYSLARRVLLPRFRLQQRVPELGATVADAVTQLGLSLDARGVADAVDREVVRRGAWAETPLSAGARVEILAERANN